jgi:TolB-like protein/DNA-binding winged helix-turn-helix (wHTH) protein/Tfp pilus assembly protein PilF
LPTQVKFVPMGPEPVKAPDRVKFGEDYELDLRAGELRRSGRLLKLERIPADLLMLLIERQGELVTRDQIIERIWGKDVFLDTDNSINAAIRKIRQVLKDDPAQPRFVQTITGRGYRFIAPVTGTAAFVPAEAQAVVIDSYAPPVDSPASPTGNAATPGAGPLAAGDEVPFSPPPRNAQDEAGDTLVSPLPRLVAWRWPLPVAVSFVLVIAVAAYFLWFRSRGAPATSSERVVMAVLPFENLTGDAGQEYFSDGMTEEMIAQLGRLDPDHLGVIARTSVMVYKQSPKPLDEIGRELGVQYVLEGSVRRDATKVRITAQLIQMKDQTHLWARQYDRELKSLLTLEGEIAQEIADEIQLTLGDNRKRIEQARKPSLSPEQYGAYDLYLEGLYFWNKRTTPGFQQAIQYFQQAIAKDPNYAPAYAGLADSYSLLGGYSLGPQQELMPKARAAAVRALELDDSLAEAHTALALIVQDYDWDWQTAEKEYRRAIQLNPNYATGHHWYAEHLAFLGRFDEALRESERARQLDPLSLIIRTDNAVILYFSRQYDRAIEQYRAVMKMDPDPPRAAMAVHPYVEKGMFAEALAEIEKRSNADGENPWILSDKVYVYSRSGRPAEARRALAKLQEAYQHSSLDPAAMIWAYAGMGDRDQTIAWLEKGYAQHSNALNTLKVEPVFDFLRSDSRFQNLMQRIGLEPTPNPAQKTEN